MVVIVHSLVCLATLDLPKKQTHSCSLPIEKEMKEVSAAR
jgi:hypothetical protein